MWRPTWIALLCVLMVLALMACANSPTTYSAPSTAPTVQCSENAPGERLESYPAGPRIAAHESAAELRGRRASLADYERALEAADASIAQLIAYSGTQSEWAIGAAGVVERNAIRRNTTASCLDDYRRRGLIQ